MSSARRTKTNGTDTMKNIVSSLEVVVESNGCIENTNIHELRIGVDQFLHFVLESPESIAFKSNWLIMSFVKGSTNMFPE